MLPLFDALAAGQDRVVLNAGGGRSLQIGISS